MVLDYPLSKALHVLDLRLLLGELAGPYLEQAALSGLVDELPILLGELDSLGVSMGGALGTLLSLLGALPLSAGASPGKWRLRTLIIVFSSTQSIPSYVYTSGR